MKRLLTLSLVSLSLLFGISRPAHAQESSLGGLCFSDGFGYVYTFSSHKQTGPKTYILTGTSTAYSSSTVTLKIVMSSKTSGTMEMKVVNDNPDGCTSASDGYLYTGTISLSKSGGHPVGTGSGSWQSYCFGGVINTGTWTASGPCASPGRATGITPASGSKIISANTEETALSGLCFSDGFGYVYTFTSHKQTGPKTYILTGTSTAYSSSTVTLKIVMSSKTSGTMEMKVVNDNPDGCTTASDGYLYTGTISLSKSGGHPVGTGSGSWQSYCFGGVINTGTWTASGPCASPGIKPAGINPASGNNKITNASKSSISIKPNPVVNQTQLSYNVVSAGKVMITIYNDMQQPVKVLVNQIQAAGNYSVSWNTLNAAGSAVPSGIYKVVGVIGNETLTGSIQVIK